MVLCRFFPREECDRGGSSAVLRRSVILLNHFSPLLRHFSKSCGGPARPFPWFESPYACTRSYLMAFSCLLLYHALRSFCFPGVHGSIFRHGGVQFQANVLPRGNGGSILRGSVRREGKHRPHRQVVVRRDRADVRTGRRKRGAAGPWKGSSEGGKPSGVRRCAAFAEKLPVFLLFTGTFATKFALFFLVLRFFAR